MVVAVDTRPVFFLLFVAIPLAALLDDPNISLSAQVGSDLPTWVKIEDPTEVGQKAETSRNMSRNLANKRPLHTRRTRLAALVRCQRSACSVYAESLR